METKTWVEISKEAQLVSENENLQRKYIEEIERG